MDLLKLHDHAIVRGDAVVCDNAIIRGNALICDNAIVRDEGIVRDDATVFGKKDMVMLSYEAMQ